MARLTWKQRGGEAKTFALGKQTIVGRDEELDCSITVKSVSRKHAKIEQRDSGFYLTDLGSTNGTLVNGTRIRLPTLLGSGDRIRLGDETLEFDGHPSDVGTGQLTRGSMATEPLSPGEVSPAKGVRERDDGSPESLPRRAGKFFLTRQLGVGGMGTVYAAIDLDSNQEVAVKFIRSRIGRNEAFLDFFHNREAVLAREIDHPNVIRTFDHGVDAGQHFISMEYVHGKNLHNVMRERSLSTHEVLEILRQLSCGLVAAHRQGVVHSDIKPANVLLQEGLADSGLAGGNAPPGSQDPEDTSDGILEFDTNLAESEDSALPRGHYEPGLLEEIRRRVGEPAVDLVVDPPYFPRQSEMTFLKHYFERMLEQRGYFVLVEGEVGSGKKRLISEFLKDMQAGFKDSGSHVPVKIYEFDCSRIEGIPNLYEQLFHVGPARSISLRQTADELSRLLAEDPAPKVVRLLNLGAAIPIACDLIVTLSRLMPSKGVLVLGSLGPEEIRSNGSLKQPLEGMAPYTKELYLRPLTAYQVQRFLHQVFRDGLSEFDLATDVYRLSGGNFSRLLEILRNFFERGVLSADPTSGRLLYRPRVHEFELEEGKNLYEKFRSLGRVEQNVIEQAGFIGRNFIFDTLMKLHDINETSLFFVVRTMLAEGFFAEEGRAWYSFTNVAFQRYMAERIPSSERPHLHRRISRLLQMVAVAETPELHQMRAWHFAGCHEYAKAVQSLLEGAHLARCEYRADLARELVQEILRIYRLLARRETVRKEVTGILRDWFRRDGNWYEILGEMGSDSPLAKVKIADFGISFRMSDEERGYPVGRRPVLGTPRYIAPERGKGGYGGFKSDVFGLGIITYEMAVGRPPFPELKGSDVIQANRELRVSLPADVAKRFPTGMGALLDGMLQKDPQLRWDAERVVMEVVKLQFDAKSGSSR
jgi:hypothetical protein